MQIINCDIESAYCEKCGTNVTELGAHTFSGRIENTPAERKEHCFCNRCKTPFIIRYPLFGEDGHISRLVFSEDINDPNYKWTDSLSEEQKKSVISHLNSCIICQEGINDEMLKDAWFASMIHKGEEK